MLHHASSGRNEVRHFWSVTALVSAAAWRRALPHPNSSTAATGRSRSKSADRSAHSNKLVLHCVNLFARREWPLV